MVLKPPVFDHFHSPSPMDYDDHLMAKAYGPHNAKDIPVLMLSVLEDDPGVVGINILLNGKTVLKYQAL